MKADPLRGGVDENETNLEAAIREVEEESFGTIKLKMEDLESLGRTNDMPLFESMYNVRVDFVDSHDEVSKICQTYDTNKSAKDEPDDETFGLIWVDPEDSSQLDVRMASQTKTILQQFSRINVDSLRPLTLVYDESDSSWKSSGLRKEESPSGQSAIPQRTESGKVHASSVYWNLPTEFTRLYRDQIKNFPQDRFRMILFLAKDNSIQEVAQMLDLPESTITQEQERARRLLLLNLSKGAKERDDSMSYTEKEEKTVASLLRRNVKEITRMAGFEEESQVEELLGFKETKK